MTFRRSTMMSAIRMLIRLWSALSRLLAARREDDDWVEPFYEEPDEPYSDYEEDEPPTFLEVCNHLSRCHKWYRVVSLGGNSQHWSVCWYEPDADENDEPVASGRFAGRISGLPFPQVSYGFWDYPDAVFVGHEAAVLLRIGIFRGLAEPSSFDMTAWFPEELGAELAKRDERASARPVWLLRARRGL
jgi:hypothetical protein